MTKTPRTLDALAERLTLTASVTTAVDEVLRCFTAWLASPDIALDAATITALKALVAAMAHERQELAS